MLTLLLLMGTHALAKAGLFLGVGLHTDLEQRWRALLLTGMALLSLTLAGAPLLGGMLVKAGLEASLAPLGVPAALLLTSSLATSLLLGRLLWVLASQPAPAHAGLVGGWLLPWGLLVLLAISYAWLWFGLGPATTTPEWLASYPRQFQSWVKSSLPPLGAALLLWLWWRSHGHPGRVRVPYLPRIHWRIPEGRRLSHWEGLMQSWPGVGLLLAWSGGVLGLLLAHPTGG